MKAIYNRRTKTFRHSDMSKVYDSDTLFDDKNLTVDEFFIISFNSKSYKSFIKAFKHESILDYTSNDIFVNSNGGIYYNGVFEAKIDGRWVKLCKNHDYSEFANSFSKYHTSVNLRLIKFFKRNLHSSIPYAFAYAEYIIDNLDRGYLCYHDFSKSCIKLGIDEELVIKLENFAFIGNSELIKFFHPVNDEFLQRDEVIELLMNPLLKAILKNDNLVQKYTAYTLQEQF